MRIHVRCRSLPIQLLEGIIKENEKELACMRREREKNQNERPQFDSFYDFLLERYQRVFDAECTQIAVTIGTAANGVSVYVQGIPRGLTREELVLNPYWSKIVVLSDRSLCERNMLIQSSCDRERVDDLELTASAKTKESWISSSLVIPLERIYTHAEQELAVPVLRQAYAHHTHWQETGQRTA